MNRSCVPSGVALLAAVVYGWSVTRQIQMLACLCDEQRQELQKLTITYQEKVLPALAEVDFLLKKMT